MAPFNDPRRNPCATCSMTLAMLALPPAAASVLRSVLTAEGFPADTIGPDNALDPVLFLSGFYNTLDVDSNIVGGSIPLSAFGGPSGPILGLLRPEVTFSGRAGVASWAPKGKPIPWLKWIVLPALVAGIFALGYGVGQKNRRST